MTEGATAQGMRVMAARRCRCSSDRPVHGGFPMHRQTKGMRYRPHITPITNYELPLAYGCVNLGRRGNSSYNACLQLSRHDDRRWPLSSCPGQEPQIDVGKEDRVQLATTARD